MVLINFLTPFSITSKTASFTTSTVCAKLFKVFMAYSPLWLLDAHG